MDAAFSIPSTKALGTMYPPVASVVPSVAFVSGSGLAVMGTEIGECGLADLLGLGVPAASLDRRRGVSRR